MSTGDDREFHESIYTPSENPLIASAMQAQWTSAQRLMDSVLMRGEWSSDLWTQHEALLSAVAGGKVEVAEDLARLHVMQAADLILTRLRYQRQPVATSNNADGSAPNVQSTKDVVAKANVPRGSAHKTGTNRKS